MPSPKPTEKPARQSPTPTDETVAIRALREVRRLDAVIARLRSEVADKEAERKELLDALPAEARRILGVLGGPTQ